MNPNLDPLTDLLNLMIAANNSTVDEDSGPGKFSQKVTEFFTIDGFDKWSDWVDFDGLFKLVAENFYPSKGVDRIPIEAVQSDNDGIVSALSTYVIGYSQDDYSIDTLNGDLWYASNPNYRFRVGIPAKKTVRDVPFDTVIKSVELADGTTYSNVTRVKGGVLSIVDGEITIHDLDDVKDFDL